MKVNSFKVMLFIPTPLKPSFMPFLPSSSEKKSKFRSTIESAKEIHCVDHSLESGEVVFNTYKWVKSRFVVLTNLSELKNTFQLPLSPSVVLESPMYSISSKSIGFVSLTMPFPSSSIWQVPSSL